MLRKITLLSLFLAVTMLGIFSFAHVSADTYVQGYLKGNGTYVQPHYRSSPDRSYNNNWSTRPNVNPYTGQRGTLAPRANDYSGSYLPSIPGMNGSGLYGR